MQRQMKMGNSQYVDLPPLRSFFAPIAFSAFKSHPGDAADMVVSDYVSFKDFESPK
jgi:hypothetical protein